MIRDILNLAKALVGTARNARPAVPVQQRPKLDGRRGYGDGDVKGPDRESEPASNRRSQS
jgi:hypothetical protein